MENPQNYVIDSPSGNKNLPNATAVLVLGIISIALFWCYGVIGLTCGIIALVLAGKDMKLYNANPGVYTETSLKNLKAGRVCAIIGTVLSGLFVLYILVILVFVGSMISTIPWQEMGR